VDARLARAVRTTKPQ
jgi:hypothetical protein